MKNVMGKVYESVVSLFYRFLPLAVQAQKAGVKMGKNNYIASRFWGSEPYLISIGDNCYITAGVKLFTHGGGQVLREKYPDFDCFGKIELGDFVYLGNNALVMPGITIGNNVLVAAGSVITKSVPSNVVVGGNPAKILCSIDDYEKKNMIYNLNSKSLSPTAKRQLLLSLPDFKFIHKGYMNTFPIFEKQ